MRYTYDKAGNVRTTLVKTETGKYTKTVNTYDAWGNQTVSNLYRGFFHADGTAIDTTTPAFPICDQTLYDWDGQVLLECKGLNGYQNSESVLKDWWNSTSVTGYAVTKYNYDNFRRLTEKTDARGKKESFRYDYAGRVVETIDRNNVVHGKSYDEAGRVKTEVSGGKIIKAYIYSPDGNVGSLTEGTLKTGTTIGAPVIEKPTTISYVYDGIGNIIQETCGIVLKTFKETNIMNKDTITGKELLKTITVGRSEKQQIKEVYDVNGQLTAVYDKGILKASYTYDLLGQPLTTTNANGTTEVNTYNNAGLVTSTINKRSTIVNSTYHYTYYYDDSQKTKTDITGTTEYTYDGCGQLTKTVLGNRSTQPDNTSSTNAVAITVDTPTGVRINTMNRARYFKFTPAVTGTYIITSTDRGSSDPDGYLYNSEGKQLACDYDSNGDLNFKIEYTLTAGTEYVIGAEMRYSVGNFTLSVTQQSGNANTSLANAAILAAGAPAKVTIGVASQMRYFKFTPKATGTYIISSTDNGSSDPYGYLYTSGGTTLSTNDDSDSGRNFKIIYTLNAGTSYVIGAKIFSTGTGSYTLTVKQFGSNAVQEFIYDTNGNRTRLTDTKNGIATVTTYTYDKNNRLLTEKVGNQTQITYSYDNNGNMIEKTDYTVQVFDALGRMIQYQKGDRTDVSYTYYPDGMRKSKGNTTQVWVDDEIALDLRFSDEVISSYVHGQKLITSGYGWYQYNAHGDVVSLTDSNGYVTRNYDYDPYGVQISNNAGTDNNPYRYSGEYYDAESGYTYLRARYYDPAIGRFISEDPAFDGDNWYVYCGNDPVNNNDPSGLAKQKVILFVGNSITFSSDGNGSGKLKPNVATMVCKLLGKNYKAQLVTHPGSGSKHWFKNRSKITKAIEKYKNNIVAVSLAFVSVDIRGNKTKDTYDQFGERLDEICRAIGTAGNAYAKSLKNIFVQGPLYQPKYEGYNSAGLYDYNKDQYQKYVNYYNANLKEGRKVASVKDSFSRLSSQIKKKDGTKYGPARFRAGYMNGYNDFYNDFHNNAKSGKTKYIGKDGYHTSAAGRDFLAKKWADAMRKRL